VTEKDLIEWARTEAERLRNLSNYNTMDGRPSTAKPVASAALEFLRIHAQGTHFHANAEAIFDVSPLEPYVALGHVATILEDWATFVEAGLAAALPYDARFRIDAANDLMEQAQRFLDDAKVIPAAAVWATGAALEEFLRSMAIARGLGISGDPGIQKYAQALRANGDLTAQDMKDVTSWGGHRNEAAHGDFDQLSHERAKILVESVNLFMRQKGSTTT
jgi:hypothetical protein